MVVFTDACWNHIPKAICMADSARKAGVRATFALCLVERERPIPLEVSEVYDGVFFASELYDDFESFIFRHTLYEGATCIKAKVFQAVMAKYPEEDLFVFLDPDIWVFSPPIELNDLLPKGNVFLTPHHLLNEASPEAVGDEVFTTLKYGTFNAGFIAVRRSEQASVFLEWWRQRIEKWGYVEPEKGLFNEQNWLDLVPGFMDVVVVREPGYNIAHWNIAERYLMLKGGEYVVNGSPVRFVHFSGFVGRDEVTIERYLERVPKDNQIWQLLPAYLAYLNRCGQEVYSEASWSYDCFQSGEQILKKTRLTFRGNPQIMEAFPNPFSASNETIQNFLLSNATMNESTNLTMKK